MRLGLPAVAALWMAGAAAVCAQSPAALVTNDTCTGCHEQAKKLKGSAHAAVACATCHVKHEEYPHPAKIPKPVCATCHEQEAQRYESSVHGQETKKGNAAAPNCATCHSDPHETASTRTADFRKSVPETCGMCHDKEAAEFHGSVHGKAVAQGISQAPVCTDCHGEHAILRPKNPGSSVFPTAVAETCGRCHGDLKLTQRFGIKTNAVSSYNESFHGLALKAGQPAVASCASCHGYHGILPSSDPKSSINPRNIAATCGHCHPGAGTRFQIGPVHSVDAQKQPPPVRYAQWFYLMVIPGTIGLMALHHLGDFVRKLFFLRFRRKQSIPLIQAPHAEERMHGWERVQHLLLVVSFSVLAWTGFALHYPNEWWSVTLLHWESDWPVRGTIHRAAAVVMMSVSLLHLVTLIRSRTLREHWLTLLPKIGDVREGVEGMLWRLGLKRQKPYQSPHSYIEKAEYWAVVWGTAVMAATGILLWANNWTLRVLPKWAIDFSRTVHFYEAVLATLAIVVWHFYMVIFDPEVYPMDSAWLTGKSPRRREAHPPAEPGRQPGD
jgi:cytochrome b subunit of formate dehydrogenase